MKHQPLFLKIFVPFLALSGTIVIILTYFLGLKSDQAVRVAVTDSLRREVMVVARRLSPIQGQQLNRRTKSFLADTFNGGDVHLSVINSKDELLFDSHGLTDRDRFLEQYGINEAAQKGLGSLDEIVSARQTGFGTSTRLNGPNQARTLYVAAPVNQGTDAFVVRAGLPIEDLPTGNFLLGASLLWIGIPLLAVVSVIAYVVAKRLTKPIEELQRAASAYAEGDFEYTLPSPEPLELRLFVHALKKMRAGVLQHLRSVDNHKKELESILVSMREGIIAVDTDERIIRTNEVTVQLFGCAENVTGKLFQEVFVHSDLIEFMRFILEQQETRKRRIFASDGTERIFEVQGTVLQEKDDTVVGALLVIDDITTLHRLETMRRDFVANVSHELRTPITAIKGCVETLVQGAANNPEDSMRFLKMMERHCERLNDLVEDILSLSRIEKLEELARVEFSEGDFTTIVKNAIQDLQTIAEHAETTIASELPDELRGVFHHNLMERAVSNLISNAIKYSEPQTTVSVRLAQEDNTIVIDVSDEGMGIAKKHFARLFERFYRIDSGRARKQGGTGLGLAIVKHVAQLHKGTVSVSSVEGRGSTFTIKVPVNPVKFRPQLSAA